ncbi:ANL_collapsed_G0040530.mRNA.1.CDS.1 [Saccharomyces cerevisiae]|nr:ANL_HP_G0071880.mRNA.1.CDS.1 [Saccharomyces cerevisiae]CAI5044344.1 ANL_HP_G0087120.mRNA.1.CDS.1 [Saccharomyces cerevisiae]CAI5087998.1 ANL_HP_G0101840.mRNA.1.CDS.1 [Saccharomyces cerevisiae]CAI5105337.1 ANL_HP_G0106960.mRNA.1.CDS.1 [Saccharomyces cerevisiae]CAI6834077.1 ANL_collapsed_G0040530.mRNA.1.CDS.1 [Saccharomyces cerevisiae]
MSSAKPLNVYSIPELNQALDEALPSVFARLNYERSYALLDAKLYIGYSIAVVAGLSFFLDKKFERDQIVTYQKLLVGAYFVLSLLFWYFSRFIEKGTVYVGKRRGTKEEIYVKTKFEKNEPLYLVELVQKKKGENSKKELKAKLEVNKVFNESGYLQNDAYFKWFSEQHNVLDTKKNE